MQQFAAQGDHLWTRLEIWIYFEFQAVLSELEWTSVGFNEPQRSLSQWVSGAENLWGFNLRLQLEASTFRRQVKELNKVHLFVKLWRSFSSWNGDDLCWCVVKELSKSCLNALTSLDILRPIPAAYSAIPLTISQGYLISPLDATQQSKFTAVILFID